MSKYYYLISGLPDIGLEDTKQTYSVSTFKTELLPMLSASDKQLLTVYFQKFDNHNLLQFLNQNEAFDDRGNLTLEEISNLYNEISTEEKIQKNKLIPPYYPDFIQQFLTETEKDKTEPDIRWEDRLSALYYAHAMKCSNQMMAQWFEFNLNISNLLVAINCRKYDLDKTRYIVGSNELSELILTSNARDFGIGEEMEYYPDLIRMADEPDLMLRERKVELLKWNWLDDQIIFKPFDFERVFAYLLRIEMIERWVNLDNTAGEEKFRELIKGMKQESANVLDEFKRNNIK